LEDPEAVRQAVRTAPSWAVAAQRLWGTNSAQDRQALKARCKDLDIKLVSRQATDILANRESIAAATAEASSVIEVLTRLDLGESSRSRLLAACEIYGIIIPRADMAAMARIGHAKAKSSYRWGRPGALLKQDPAIYQSRVRRMVLRYQLLPYECAICDSEPVWRGAPITLVLDHKNGDPSDHRLENLRFVCPNCESQLPTHGSRNRKRKAA
jgi:hypothetical protein